MLIYVIAFLFYFFNPLFGSDSSVPHFINFFEIIVGYLGLESDFKFVFISIFSLIVLFFIGFYYKITVEKNKNFEKNFSLKVLIDWILDIIFSISKDNCGKYYLNYMPFLSAIFLYILINNLIGLVPGFSPGTEDISTSLSIGLFSFFIYNFAGLKEHGFSYFKQFMGPILLMAPLFLIIESISHISRPLSLSLRLVGNIYGDHLLLSVFTGLTKIFVPSLLLFFGLLVACIQSFVFTLLTSLYISMAISHDH